MGFLRGKLTDEERAEELFSSYIDGQVTAEERRFLERYLADYPQAREKFELLKAAVQLTKTLPLLKAPRSFVLPRSMARKPTLRLGSGWALRLYPAMRFATVAATALFVFALVGDLATSSRLAAPAPAAGMILSRSAATALVEAPAAEAPAAAMTATPAPLATQEAALGEATGGADVTKGTPEPAAAAQFAAPTASPPGEPDEEMSRQAESVSTPEPTAEQSAERLQADTEAAAAEATGVAQIDVLRLAVIALAGLVVVLAAATLAVRRRVR